MLKVGIIGSGFGLYGQLPAFHSLKNCRVVSVCASNQERLTKYYYRLGLQKVYSDWQNMLQNEALDAVAIAVTPKAQYEIGKVAITRRLNVFLEKPLADTYQHAKILYNLALKNQVTHAVDFMFPEIASWSKVKQLLENKTYGRLQHVSVSWDFMSYDLKNQISSWKTDSSLGGGALSYYFCHALYYLEYFAGEIQDIKSSFLYSGKGANGAETGVDLVLHFKDNIDGSAHISCHSVGLNRHQLIFSCQKATIVLENKDGFVKNFKITIYTDKGIESIKLSETAKTDNEARVDVVKKIAERFTRACLNKQQMKPSIKEGLRVQQLIKLIKAQN